AVLCGPSRIGFGPALGPVQNNYGITYERKRVRVPDIVPTDSNDLVEETAPGFTYHRLSPSHYAFVYAIPAISIPNTVKEALSHPR
ncbi:hypothetical protein A2U01_0009580, partial [Trifolium medium]|nr:hypothetical protein [Trifolium medium]